MLHNPDSEEAPASRPSITSIGYQLRSADEVFHLLQQHEVSLLVDVRLNPISRKAGFSKNSLAPALRTIGIDYRHERELGNPRENRDPFRRGLTTAREAYESLLNGEASGAFDQLLRLALTMRVAVFCYERDHHVCHMSCILDKAQIECPELKIIEV